jgi:hypothetical protein
MARAARGLGNGSGSSSSTPRWRPGRGLARLSLHLEPLDEGAGVGATLRGWGARSGLGAPTTRRPNRPAQRLARSVADETRQATDGPDPPARAERRRLRSAVLRGPAGAAALAAPGRPGAAAVLGGAAQRRAGRAEAADLATGGPDAGRRPARRRRARRPGRGRRGARPERGARHRPAAGSASATGGPGRAARGAAALPGGGALRPRPWRLGTTARRRRTGRPRWTRCSPPRRVQACKRWRHRRRPLDGARRRAQRARALRALLARCSRRRRWRSCTPVRPGHAE